MMEKKTTEEILARLRGKMSAPIQESIVLALAERPRFATSSCGSWSVLATSNQRVLLSLDASSVDEFFHSCEDLRDLCQDILDYLNAGGVVDNTIHWEMVRSGGHNERSN